MKDYKKYKKKNQYEGGFISMPTLISELKTYKLVDQYLFHTERALAAISFVKAEEIKR